MHRSYERTGGLRRRPLLLAAIAFLAQCLALYLPRVPSSGSDLPLDKVAHVVMFAVVTGLAVWAGIPWKWVVAVMVMQAIISELVQGYLLAGRGSDPWDFVADLIGIALGLGTAQVVRAHSTAAVPSDVVDPGS
jgi:VanZ family protein